MDILKAIESRNTHKYVHQMRPLQAVLDVDIHEPTPIHTIIRHKLLLQTQTVVPEGKLGNPNFEEHNLGKVRRMFAESLYGEARRDLLDILLMVQERYYDRDVTDAIEKLMRKMQ